MDQKDDIVAYIHSRLERLETKVDALSQTFATITERLSTTCTRLERLEQRPLRFAAISAGIGAIVGAFTSLAAIFYHLITRLNL